MEEWEQYSETNQDLESFPLLKKLCERKEKNGLNIDKNVIEKALSKLQNNLILINADDFELLKQLLSVMGVPFDYATSEAEGTCALLNCLGVVDAVLTEDTDVLAYGAPVMLHNFSFKDNTFMEISLNNILERLQISFDQFKDFCIMCGTDYNNNIPKVGPIKAFDLIVEKKSLDSISEKMDISCLNHSRVRTLLDCYQNTTNLKTIDYQTIDISKLKNFCFYNNILYDYEQIHSL